MDYSMAAGDSTGFQATMDIEWAHAMAALAHIAVYEWANDEKFAQHAEATAQDALPWAFHAVSYSFCLSGDDPTGGVADQEFAAAAQSGLGIFAASGDHGRAGTRYCCDRAGASDRSSMAVIDSCASLVVRDDDQPARAQRALERLIVRERHPTLTVSEADPTSGQDATGRRRHSRRRNGGAAENSTAARRY